MNPHDREKLLKEILPGEDAGNFRETSLERGLLLLRLRRRSRQLSAVAALTVCLLGFGLFLNSRRVAQTAVVRPAPTVAVNPAAATSKVTFISDDELLALFTNQPVALIGKPGQQRLVFLDKKHSEPAGAPF
jgi:hypothetical protein